MDEDSEKQLVGDFSAPTDSYLPSFIMNRSALFNIKTKAQKISWEIEGEALLKKISFADDDKKKAKLLILKGVPPSKRGEFWFVASGAKREMLEHPKYYDFLLNHYPPEIELPNEKQIDLDIDRTYPEDKMFHLPETKKKLRNILLCYSKRNLSIGYVQGFNFIVGRLMKFIPEEEKVFWVFCQIIEYILPMDFYSGMSGVIADVDILLCLFKQMYMPELVDLMKESHSIYLKNVLFQWFLSLFAINFPYDASVGIWDVLLIDGRVVLFKSALFLIKLIKDKLLSITDMERFKDYIRSYFDNFTDLNYIKYILILRKFEFDQNFIEHNRTIILEPIIDKINRNCEYKLEKLKEKTKEREGPCDPSWPFCIYECESYYKITDYLVLSQGNSCNIINDYMNGNGNDNDSEINITIDGSLLEYETALIERKEHVCDHKHQRHSTKRINKKLTNDSDSSFISTGTDRSCEKSTYNEKEREYYLKKSKYKSCRSNYRCVSSISLIKQDKEKDKTNNHKAANYNKFVSKNYHQYYVCSVAKDFKLTPKEDANEDIPYSMEI